MFQVCYVTSEFSFCLCKTKESFFSLKLKKETDQKLNLVFIYH